MFFPQRTPDLSTPVEVLPDWEISVPAESYAVSLDTVKIFLNIPLEDTFFDAEKTSLIAVAQAAVQNYCQLTLLRSTWIGNLPAFYDRIRVNKRPFFGVQKIDYVDRATGVITTVAPSVYVTSRKQQKAGLVTRGDGQAWPDAANRWDGVRIFVEAGWEESSIPNEITHAILLTIAALDRSRGEENSSGGGQAMNTVYAMKNQKAPSIIPSEAKALLAPYVYQTVTLI